MRDKIAYVREWWEEASTEKKIALIAYANGSVILLFAVAAICAVAFAHLMHLWNLIVG